jgi:hypothetical protein
MGEGVGGGTGTVGIDGGMIIVTGTGGIEEEEKGIEKIEDETGAAPKTTMAGETLGGAEEV